VRPKSEEAFIALPEPKVFPSPFRDQLVIEFVPVEDTSVSVELYNLSGERVSIPVRTSVQAMQTQQFVLNTQTLAAGIYIFRTNTGVYQGKVIK
jgi:hypothetical protein